jgi:hypothetical protein
VGHGGRANSTPKNRTNMGGIAAHIECLLVIS